jgi:hypothetical protein
MSGSKIICSVFVVMGAFSTSLMAQMQQQEPVTKPADKIAICHLREDGTFRLMQINPRALQGHLSHGDVLLPEGATDCSGVQPPAPPTTPTPVPEPVPTEPSTPSTIEAQQAEQLD